MLGLGSLAGGVGWWIVFTNVVSVVSQGALIEATAFSVRKKIYLMLGVAGTW